MLGTFYICWVTFLLYMLGIYVGQHVYMLGNKGFIDAVRRNESATNFEVQTCVHMCVCVCVCVCVCEVCVHACMTIMLYV